MSPKRMGRFAVAKSSPRTGPARFIDLPRHSAIVGGLDTWPKTSDLDEIVELRLTRKLRS